MSLAICSSVGTSVSRTVLNSDLRRKNGSSFFIRIMVLKRSWEILRKGDLKISSVFSSSLKKARRPFISWTTELLEIFLVG